MINQRKTLERANRTFLKELPYYDCKNIVAAHPLYNIIYQLAVTQGINLINLRAFLTLILMFLLIIIQIWTKILTPASDVGTSHLIILP